MSRRVTGYGAAASLAALVLAACSAEGTSEPPSPAALIDADLIGFVRKANVTLLLDVAERETISARLADALIARGQRSVTLRVLQRNDVPIPAALLAQLTAGHGAADAEIRGALLDRSDLPAGARLALVEAALGALRSARIVKRAIAAPRLERLFRDARCGSLQPATSDVCADWLGVACLGGDPDADGAAPRW